MHCFHIWVVRLDDFWFLLFFLYDFIPLFLPLIYVEFARLIPSMQASDIFFNQCAHWKGKGRSSFFWA